MVEDILNRTSTPQGRMSAKNVLLRRVVQLRDRANALEELANSLDGLSVKADEALWSIIRTMDSKEDR